MIKSYPIIATNFIIPYHYRCDLSLWFVLRIEGRGLALAACWMVRGEGVVEGGAGADSRLSRELGVVKSLKIPFQPRTVTDSPDFIGYLAVAMSEGSIVICW